MRVFPSIIVTILKLGITGTPAYIIEEQLYLGQIPPDILAKIIK